MIGEVAVGVNAAAALRREPGYLKVKLNGAKQYKVHVLIAATFLDKL